MKCWPSASAATGGAQKLRRLAEIERHVVVIQISDQRVRQTYAELSTLAQSSGWPLFHGKNDLWVGAAARAAEAHLLTMDTDFLPLRGRAGCSNTSDPVAATVRPPSARASALSLDEGIRFDLDDALAAVCPTILPRSLVAVVPDTQMWLPIRERGNRLTPTGPSGPPLGRRGQLATRASMPPAHPLP
ncbi:hypothetical protein BH18ACI5_BH18ACI5_03810 [soil metagenome]